MAQNPAQYVPEMERMRQNVEKGHVGNSFPYNDLRNLTKSLADGEGFEPPEHSRTQQFSRLPP